MICKLARVQYREFFQVLMVNTLWSIQFNNSIFNWYFRSIARVNSLKARLETKEVFANAEWEQNVNKKYSEKSLQRQDSLRQLSQK